MSEFDFKVNLREVADKVGKAADDIGVRVTEEISNLSISTHAFVVRYANEKLEGFKRNHFLGEEGQNVRWNQVAPNIWVVEIDESVAWIEEGRCVVYSDNPSHIPKVLTPDGDLPITKVKKGTMVLNNLGKWTEVVNVIDQHLVEESVYEWTKVKCSSVNKDPKKNKREKTLSVLGVCVVCGHEVAYKKWKKTYKNMKCNKCFLGKQLVSIEMKGRPFKGKKMVLTGDHKVFTDKGWKPAVELTDDDLLKTPSWSKCIQCT